MPLIHSKSKEAFKENIKKEVHAGKPVKQAVAIAYATKRGAKNKTLSDKKNNMSELDTSIKRIHSKAKRQALHRKILSKDARGSIKEGSRMEYLSKKYNKKGPKLAGLFPN